MIERLAEATRNPVHEFWADDCSILDPATADRDRVHGAKQITDIYLLALAVAHGGRFVTFDGAIPVSAVPRATSSHLLVL